MDYERKNKAGDNDFVKLSQPSAKKQKRSEVDVLLYSPLLEKTRPVLAAALLGHVVVDLQSIMLGYLFDVSFEDPRLQTTQEGVKAYFEVEATGEPLFGTNRRRGLRWGMHSTVDLRCNRVALCLLSDRAVEVPVLATWAKSGVKTACEQTVSLLPDVLTRVVLTGVPLIQRNGDAVLYSLRWVIGEFSWLLSGNCQFDREMALYKLLRNASTQTMDDQSKLIMATDLPDGHLRLPVFKVPTEWLSPGYGNNVPHKLVVWS